MATDKEHEILERMHESGLHEEAIEAAKLIESLSELSGNLDAHYKVKKLIEEKLGEYVDEEPDKGNGKPLNLGVNMTELVKADSRDNKKLSDYSRERAKAKLPVATPTPAIDPLKATRLRIQLVPWNFVKAMAKVFQEGLYGGRKEGDWEKLDSLEAQQDFRGALLRHYGDKQWAAVAVNAAMLWWHEQEEEMVKK